MKPLNISSDREVQIKSTMRCDFTLTRMAVIKNSNNRNPCKTVQVLWKPVGQFLRDLNRATIPLTIQSQVNIYPREIKVHFYTKTCTPTFTAACHSSQEVETASVHQLMQEGPYAGMHTVD